GELRGLDLVAERGALAKEVGGVPSEAERFPEQPRPVHGHGAPGVNPLGVDMRDFLAPEARCQVAGDEQMHESDGSDARGLTIARGRIPQSLEEAPAKAQR